jgi:hypothetical protein
MPPAMGCWIVGYGRPIGLGVVPVAVGEMPLVDCGCPGGIEALIAESEPGDPGRGGRRVAGNIPAAARGLAA